MLVDRLRTILGSKVSSNYSYFMGFDRFLWVLRAWIQILLLCVSMSCLRLFLEGFYCGLGTFSIAKDPWSLELSFRWDLA